MKLILWKTNIELLTSRKNDNPGGIMKSFLRKTNIKLLISRGNDNPRGVRWNYFLVGQYRTVEMIILVESSGEAGRWREANIPPTNLHYIVHPTLLFSSIVHEYENTSWKLWLKFWKEKLSHQPTYIILFASIAYKRGKIVETSVNQTMSKEIRSLEKKYLIIGWVRKISQYPLVW